MNRTTSILILSITLILGGVVATSAQAKPDLIIRSVTITPDASGRMVSAVKVVVMNYCTGSTAGQSFAQVSFMTSADPGAKHIASAGNTVKPLNGGEAYSQTLDFSQYKIGIGRHMIVTADPHNKVSEAEENNNVRTMYPTKMPKLISQYQCSPKM